MKGITWNEAQRTDLAYDRVKLPIPLNKTIVILVQVGHFLNGQPTVRFRKRTEFHKVTREISLLRMYTLHSCPHFIVYFGLLVRDVM